MSRLLTLPPFKRGDTFAFACTYKAAGVPSSVDGFVIQSQIRTFTKQLVANLVATLADQTISLGAFTLTPQVTDTSGWIVGDHVCDIQITQAGVTRSSITFVLPVVEDVTR